MLDGKGLIYCETLIIHSVVCDFVPPVNLLSPSTEGAVGARFTFTSPLTKSRLLLIISCHHSVASRLRLLLLLLLLGSVEAIHIGLLIVRVKIIVLLIRVHVLDVLMRCSCLRRRLHHLSLTDVLIHVHAAIAHDLSSVSAELGVLCHWWRLLMNKILRTLKSITLIARTHHETLLLIL